MHWIFLFFSFNNLRKFEFEFEFICVQLELLGCSDNQPLKYCQQMCILKFYISIVKNLYVALILFNSLKTNIGCHVVLYTSIHTLVLVNIGNLWKF